MFFYAFVNTGNTQYTQSTGLNIGIGGGALDAVKGIDAAVKNAGDNSKSDKLRDAYATQAGVQAGKLGYDVYKNNGAIAGAREALAAAEASGDLGAIAEAQRRNKQRLVLLNLMEIQRITRQQKFTAG